MTTTDYSRMTGAQLRAIKTEQDYNFIAHFLHGYCQLKTLIFYSASHLRQSTDFATVKCQITGEPKIDWLSAQIARLDERRAELARYQSEEPTKRKVIEEMMAARGFCFRQGYSLESIEARDAYDPQRIMEPTRDAR